MNLGRKEQRVRLPGGETCREPEASGQSPSRQNGVTKTKNPGRAKKEEGRKKGKEGCPIKQEPQKEREDFPDLSNNTRGENLTTEKVGRRREVIKLRKKKKRGR